MDDGTWRAAALLESPHRLGFFAAGVLLVLASLWWLAWMLARHAFALPWVWTVPPGLAHGLLFGFGFMPLFFAGFLFTAAPKWLQLPPQPPRDLLGAVLTLLAGWGLFVAGVHLQVLGAAAGLVLVALAWGRLVRRLAALLRLGRGDDLLHLRVIVAASRLGAAVLWMTALALAIGREDAARAALQLGLWGFVAPVFVAAAHRLVPFLGEGGAPRLAAWQPRWVLWSLLVLCLLQAPFALADLWWWPQPRAWQALQIVLDGGAALLLGVLAWRWARQQGLRLRLIAMLHLGLVWLAVAFALAALSQALLWASAGTNALGLAAQHAFTMGFLGSTMFAMVTRVASGYAGRSVAADDPAWGLFLALQLAVLLRVIAASLGERPWMLVAAALAWALALLPWALRLAAWFGRRHRAQK